MSEKNRKWDKQSQQDWERNRRRYDQDIPYDYNREMSGDLGNSANNYRNKMRRNFDEASYGYNAGYGDRYNRQGNWNQGQSGYSSGMYGSEYPGYRCNPANSGHDANSGYLGGQGSYNAYENEMDYENVNRGDYDRDWWDKTRDEVSSWFGDEDAERRRNTDRQMAGMHKGKGPKGYTRSDQRIQEDVCDRLSDDVYLDASNIEVKVQEGEVMLSGTVMDREQKRRAEDLVERISGVRDVENHIKVKREDRDTYSSIR